MDEVQLQTTSNEEIRFRTFMDQYSRSHHDWGHRAARTSTTHRIQKVMIKLRENENSRAYYEPRVVSLGPIHHGKEEYQLEEASKYKLAKEFVESSGKTIEEIYNEIEKNIKKLEECFEEEVTRKYSEVDLAWILVVDGCAILQYIYLAVEDKLVELNIKPNSVAFFNHDLFLLENQVPYDLLELLMSLSNVGDELRNSVERFIQINHDMVLIPDKSWHRQSGKQPENGKRKPTHLLDLLRSSLLGPEKPSHTIDLFINLNSDWQSYRNVQELKAAGIHVKQSKDNFLRGIYFNRSRHFFPPGILSLPRLIVDDSTRPKLLNLIAYEMCRDFDNDNGITSYVSFLSSLIDEANHVKELRKARVLLNLFSSDKEVARLFNEIGTNLVPAVDQYHHVKMQIQHYFDNKIMVWMAELFHDIFSRPWKIVAFLGSLSALVLTATQTLYSPSGPCNDFCKKFT